MPESKFEFSKSSEELKSKESQDQKPRLPEELPRDPHTGEVITKEEQGEKRKKVINPDWTPEQK